MMYAWFMINIFTTKYKHNEHGEEVEILGQIR